MADRKTAATAIRRSPSRSRRGRPARLSSREEVLQKALELLNTCQLEELTMTRVAKTLGIATTSLYTYFPSRDALLEALAEHVFGLFQAPDQGHSRWQDKLLAWQHALWEHLLNNPALVKLMGWEGRTSRPYYRVQASVARILHDQGLDGEQLAYALSWFLSSTVGLLLMECDPSPQYRQGLEPGLLESLKLEDQRLMLELMPHVKANEPVKIVEFGLQNIIKGLEDLVAGKTVM